MTSYKDLQAQQEARRIQEAANTTSAPISTQRRQYNERVQAHKAIERDIARQNGTLEPTSAKVKRFTLSFLFGWFFGSLFR
jgi:hypothetical protein